MFSITQIVGDFICCLYSKLANPLLNDTTQDREKNIFLWTEIDLF